MHQLRLLLLPLLLLLPQCTPSGDNGEEELGEVHDVCGLHGSIESPGYPGPYPDQALHTWHISVPSGYRARLQFAHFDLETSVKCQYDYVKVSAGNESLDNFCGQESMDGEHMPGNQPIAASGNSINVTFRTDFSNEERFTGFKAYFTAVVPRINPPAPATWLHPRSRNQKSQSDIDECAEGDAGGNEQACQHDCYNYPGGFHCSCRYGYQLDKDDRTCTVECSGQEFTERRGEVTSPEYPRPYPRALQCKFTLRLEEGYLLTLNFRDTFDVEIHPEVNTCPYDSLTIRSGGRQWGPLCGRSLPDPIETKSSVAEIVFTSDKSGDNTGWRIHYTSEGIACPSVNALTNGDFEPKQLTYHFKDGVVFSCEIGYKLIQSENGKEADSLRMTCLNNGTWDRMPPTCKIVDCGFPPLLAHGFTDPFFPTTTYNEKVTFECSDAYRFTTPTNGVFTCNESGHWANPVDREKIPTCEPVCGEPKYPIEQVARIVGGYPARSGNFPWQALIRKFSHRGGLQGGGSLLNDRWIITAAHVVEDFLPHEIFITLGALNQKLPNSKGSTETRTVDKRIIHPGYKPNQTFFDNDIALLRLAGDPVSMTDTVRPICLPKVTEGGAVPKLVPHNVGFVSGWGHTKAQVGSTTSQGLKYVELPIVEDNTCMETNHDKSVQFYTHNTIVTGNMFCAGYPQGGKDACQGDSGGPFTIVVEGKWWYLMGLVSWGISCAKADQYGVYTRVDKYLDWLHSEMANNT